MPAMAATTDAWPAATIATLPGARSARGSSGRPTARPSSDVDAGRPRSPGSGRRRGRRRPARRPTRRGRAWRSRRAAGTWRRGPGSGRPGETLTIGQIRSMSSGSSHSASTPLSRLALTRRRPSRTSPEVVGEVDDAALAEQQVVVELLGEALPQLERVLVDRGALVPQVVAADDRRVAGHVPAGQPAPLEDGHVRDPVVLREVVGRRPGRARRRR